MRTILLLAALVGAVAIVPGTASADTFVCLPSTPAGSTCTAVRDTGGWIYANTCHYHPSAYGCAGGGHWDYSPTPYVGNGFGGYACSNGVCAAWVVGQEDYFGTFDAYGGVGSSGGPAGGMVAYRAGTAAGTPFVDVTVCANTVATGGPCILV
jgi:hypothetical protein